MKNLLFAIFISLTTFAQAQVGSIPADPTPPKPGEQPLNTPTEAGTIAKQSIEQAIAQKNATLLAVTNQAPGVLNPGQNPQVAPEINLVNRFQVIPVNLFTGTPIINFPVFTLAEPGGASVPIGFSFNSAGMKAHDVASWVGMNWTLFVGAQITRVVRGIPDEGKYFLESDYSTSPRKGFYQYGLKADNNADNDSQSDLYFLNINGQSYKFTFDANRKAHFFPEADIKVTVDWIPRGFNQVVGDFYNWRVIMPDGTNYLFAIPNSEETLGFESSFEIEASEILDNNGGQKKSNSQMAAYKLAENTRSAYYVSKIITSQGHETVFEYRRSAFSFFRVAEQSAKTENCTFNNISQKINKVFNQSSVLYKISNNNTVVEFNKDGWGIGVDEYSGQPFWYLTNVYPTRTDIDEYGPLIKNYSTGTRALHKISVYDKATPTNILEWKFKYDYLTSPNPAVANADIPFGYTTTVVGNTHRRRFKLRSIEEPDGNKYLFKYFEDNLTTAVPTRLTQGVDHWGYLNGQTNSPNLIGQDAFRVCASAQYGNRTASSSWSQYGTITAIIHSTGGSSVLEYENHNANNYSSMIGGSRVNKITFIDSVSNIKNIKTFNYLKTNGQPSGFLALKPIYHFEQSGNFSGLADQYWVSGLYQQLLSETGRPAVGYSNVKESIIDQSSNLLGYTKSDFLQPLTSPNMQEVVTYNCVTRVPPEVPYPVTTCDTLKRIRPYRWNPYHENNIGSPTKIAIYNASGQVLSENSMVYGESPIETIASQTAYRSFRMEGQNYNFLGAYYDYSVAFRTTSDTSKVYSLDGTKPIITINQYIYKDQMDNAYKANYPGKHNQLVKTTTTNSLGHQIESHTKYAADFDFGGVEPSNVEAKGVYQLQQRHIISSVVESISKQNGNIVGATYQNYDAATGLQKESYSIENLPRPSMAEVNFNAGTWTKDDDYDLKNSITSYNTIGLPTQLNERFGAVSKVDYDATNTLPIKTYKNFGAADQQSTQAEYSKKIFGISKEIGTNDLEVRNEFYPNGKLKQVLDKDNKVLKHYSYLYRGTIDATLKTDSSKNRIITRVPRIATTDPTALSYLDCNITIQYLDGAGRSLEMVAYKASPNAKSIISGATGYDVYGRAIRNYLPIESDFGDGRFVDTTSVHNKAKIFYGDNICYSQVIYENSPLSRPLKSYGSGTAFRATNKYSETKYETIDTESGLKRITALIGQNKGFIENYTTNQLLKKISLDERGSAVIEYSDKSGNVIRRDVQSTDSEYLTTAYVFDDANRLRYVLPPNAYNAVKNQSEFTETDPVFNEMIYAYHYDGRNRAYEAHTPGTGWSRVVYNRLNQPVLTQDDDEANTNTWNYVQTDGQGRTVRTGQIQIADSPATLQGYFDNYKTANSVEAKHFEERSTAGGNVAQYTNRSFPPQLQSLITEQSIKTTTYYDNYDWRNGINASTGLPSDYDFQSNTLNTVTAYSKTNSAVGLNTGGFIKDDLNGNLFMPSASYYDDKNRSIQSISFTHLLARDQIDTKYNFNGEVAKSKVTYRQYNKADITKTTSHTYDHMSRPKSLMYGLSLYNSGTEFPMNFFNYDPLGRMKTKYIQPTAQQIGSTEQTGLWSVGTTWQGGSTPNLQTLAIINPSHTVNIPNDASVQASSLMNNGTLVMGTGSVLTLGSMATVNRVALQTIDYTYNIRNQLRGINLDASGNMQTNPEKLFSYKLDYHEDDRYYDGNISKQSWKSYSSVGGNGADTRTYTYTYDRSNRVNNASFTGKGNEAYGVSNISYDIMGNLQTMDRLGKIGANSWGEIDKLAYTYINSGNKLQQVDDTGQNATAGGFINGNSGVDHSYTNAGKITSDLNKGISLIEYNFLDLVKKQTFSDKTVEYGYSSTGQRRMRKVTKNGVSNYTFYNGEIIYTSPDDNIQNAAIVEVQNAEGRFVDGKFTYGYTDQVGNLRLSYRDSVLATGGLTSIVVQENAYDVWGNELDGLSFNLGQKDNYLISGKELDSESGNTLLDWRDYDPTTGRMKNPDPMGSEGGQISLSPYQYGWNNPVVLNDPSGKCPWCIAGAIIGAGVNLYRNKDAIMQGGRINWGKAAGFAAVGGLEGAFIAAAPGVGFARVAASTFGRAVLSGTVKSIVNVSLGGHGAETPLEVITDATISSLTAGTFSGLSNLFKGGNFLYGGYVQVGALTYGQVEKEIIEDGVKQLKWVDDFAGHKVGELVGGGSSKVYRAFTSANFRTNLGRLTGEIPSSSQAHHVFPQSKEFTEYFLSKGINIHDPKFGSWWSTASHGKNAYAYNKEWAGYISANGKALPSDVLNFGRQLMGRYGLKTNF
jgi:RHS repeat-associated protein